MAWYNTVFHEVRDRFSLTHLEYCIIEMIDKLAAHRGHSHNGWCNASNQYIADKQYIDVRSVKRAIQKAIDIGLLESQNRTGTSSLRRCTIIWHDAIYGAKEDLNTRDKLSPLAKKEGGQNVLPTRDKLSPYNNIHNNSNIVDSHESTTNTPNSSKKEDKLNSQDEKTLTYLEAIGESLKKYGKKLTIPTTKTELRKYYAYKAVKRSINDFKATVEQWQAIINLKGLEWKSDAKMIKYLKCDTIVAHWHKYLEDVEGHKGNEAPTDDIKLSEANEVKYQAFLKVYSVEGTNLTQVSRADYKWFFIDNFRRIEVKVARTAIDRELKNIIAKAKSGGTFGSLYKMLYNWYELKIGAKRSY